eukprot:570129_1
MASKFERIEALKNQTVLQKEKLLQILDLKYSYHVYHLLQQRYLIAQHIQTRYDLLINYMNSLYINGTDNNIVNDLLLQRILGLIKSLDTNELEPLPDNEPQLHDEPKREINMSASPVQHYQYPETISQPTHRHTNNTESARAQKSKSKTKYMTKHKRKKPKQNELKREINISPPEHIIRNTNSDKTTKSKTNDKRKKSREKEWNNTELSSLITKDIRILLMSRGAIKKDLNGVKKSRLIELLKENYTVSLSRPWNELRLADLHSELRLRGLDAKLTGYITKKDSIIKILNGESVKAIHYTYKPSKPKQRGYAVCADCLEKCDSTRTVKCSRCFREYHTSCIGKGKICKLCLDKNADRRSKRLKNKPTNYTEIIPTPTSIIGINLANTNIHEWQKPPCAVHDEEYLPPEECKKDVPPEQDAPDLEYPPPPLPPPEQLSGHKRLLQEMNMIPPEQYHQYHDVPSQQILKRVKLNSNGYRWIPPQSQLQRPIPALTKRDGMDDIVYDNMDPSWTLRKEGKLRGAVHNLVYGTKTFSQLPTKCKAIIGIALMNEIVRGSDNDLKKFPMWHRTTVRDVLVEVGGGKPAQYACSGVLLDGRVTNVKGAGDEETLSGYLADSEVIEMVKRNVMNQQDTKKKTHCQQVIKCFEDAMKAQMPTEEQLREIKALFRPYNMNQSGGIGMVE